MKTKTITNPGTTIKLTHEEAVNFGIDIKQDQNKGILKTYGAWSIPVSYKALCVSKKYTKDFYTKCTEVTIYGQRTITHPKQGGHELEGRVSIGGKKYTCFTSSQLFEIEGKLIDVATIHARI